MQHNPPGYERLDCELKRAGKSRKRGRWRYKSRPREAFELLKGNFLWL
jgi:hypothetical protein